MGTENKNHIFCEKISSHNYVATLRAQTSCRVAEWSNLIGPPLPLQEVHNDGLHTINMSSCSHLWGGEGSGVPGTCQTPCPGGRGTIQDTLHGLMRTRTCNLVKKWEPRGVQIRKFNIWNFISTQEVEKARGLGKVFGENWQRRAKSVT